jgi:hypothetical protein
MTRHAIRAALELLTLVFFLIRYSNHASCLIRLHSRLHRLIVGFARMDVTGYSCIKNAYVINAIV